MIALAPGISYVDLEFQGTPRVIATAVLHGPGGAALIDPGPSSSLPALEKALAAAGIAPTDVRALLLTHIHLDHAGAAGTLVRRWPHLRVYVHEKGAPHLINPERLLASAARLYGAAMQPLWGECLPVPEGAIVPLAGGERIETSGGGLEVIYTPGHASHHVAYLTASDRLAFVGDVAGIRLPSTDYVYPPTPPPDIDLEAWDDSLVRLERRHPGTLFLTHFGPSEHAGVHLRSLRDGLSVMGGLARTSLSRSGSDEEREAWFVDEVRQQVDRRVEPTIRSAYELVGRFDLSWRGLARYWRKWPSARG